MGNAEKRKKKSKQKAKNARIAKQNNIDTQNKGNLIRFSEDMLNLFNEIKSESEESGMLDTVPKIKQYIEQKDSSSRDLDMKVAMMCCMYHEWSTQNKTYLYEKPLKIVASEMVRNEVFLSRMNEQIPEVRS